MSGKKPRVIQLVPALESEWNASSGRIPRGVLCFSTDTGRIKIGTGKSAYADLDYSVDAVLSQAEKLILVNRNQAGGVVVLDQTTGKIPPQFFPPLQFTSPDNSVTVNTTANTFDATIVLPTTGVTAGTYGSAAYTLQATVDDRGRLTAAQEVLITPAYTSIQNVPTKIAQLGALADSADTMLYFSAAGAVATSPINAYMRGLMTQSSRANLVSALSLTPGVDVQAYNTTLAGIGAIPLTANTLIYGSGTGTAASTALTSQGRSLIGASTAAGAQSVLSLTPGTDILAYNARLQAIATASSAADKLIYSTGVSTVGVTDFSSYGRTLVALADLLALRTHIGLGSAAYQATSAFQPTNAALTSIASLATSADQMLYATSANTYSVATLTPYARTILDDTDAASARSTLGLVIGTNVQAYDATLQALSNVSTAADKLIYATGIDTFATADFTSYGRTLVAMTAASDLKTNLGLGSAAYQNTTAFQAANAALTSIASLATSADQMVYTSASNTYNTTPLTTFARSLLDDADAAAMRTTLGLVIGTNVQGYDAGLASISGLTGTGVMVATATDTYSLRAIGATNSTDILDRSSADGRYLSLSNSTASVSGTVNFTGSLRLGGVNVATTAYVDSVVSGNVDKGIADVATTGSNITLSGIQTIDGVTGAVGLRVMVKDQTLKSENGLYLMASGAWVRATNMDTWAEIPGARVYVNGGTSPRLNSTWRAYAPTAGTLGTTDIVWSQDSGVGTYTASAGVTVAGNDFQLTGQALALHNLATNGIYVRTGSGTVSARSLVAPSAGIGITNANGVAGNITFSLTNDLGALEGLSGTGFAVRTAADTWATRSLTGTANQVILSNDGSSGNIVFSLPQSIATTSAPSFAGGTLTGLLNFNAGLGGLNNGIRWQGGTKDLRLTMKDSDRVVFTDETDGQVLFSFYEGGDFVASVGNIQTTQRLISTVATGTQPLGITSTTMVDNLNAQYIDGLQASQLLRNDQAGTVDGTLTVNNALGLNGGDDSRAIEFKTEGVDRWRNEVQGSEILGDGTGSDWYLNRHGNTGEFLSTVMSASRSTGIVSFSTEPTVDGSPVWHAGNLTPGNYAALAGASFTGNVSITNASPAYTLVESDQTGAAGVWRVISSAGSLVFSRNTAAARDFTTSSNDIVVSPAGATTFASTATATRLISTIATGTSPLAVTSTTRVNNLNVQYLNGLQSTQLLRNDAAVDWAGAASGYFRIKQSNSAGSSTTATNTLTVRQDTAAQDAFMTFDAAGSYTINFGIDAATNNVFVGGGSMGAVKCNIWHSGNLTPGNYAQLAGADFTGQVNVSSASPWLGLYETDQTLPAGRWAWNASVSSLYLKRNTAAAGDFSTADNVMAINGSSKVTFSQQVTAPSYYAAGSSVGTLAADVAVVADFAATAETNTSRLITQLYRHTAGTGWSGTSMELRKRVDVTDQAFVRFGYNGGSSGLSFGTGTTEYLKMDNSGNWTIGSTSTRNAVFSGSNTTLTTRYDDTALTNPIIIANYGVAAASQGVAIAARLGTGGVSGANAGYIRWNATDTWAAAANQSTKAEIGYTTAGSLIVGLTVDGNGVTAPKFVSSVATGTAPLTVSSTTVVPNLNSELWGGRTMIGRDTSLLKDSGDYIAAGIYYNGGWKFQKAAGNTGFYIRHSDASDVSAGQGGRLDIGFSSGNSTGVDSTAVTSNRTFSFDRNGSLTLPAPTGTAPLVVSSNTLVTNLNAHLLSGYGQTTSPTANSIVARDGNGVISGSWLQAIGSQALINIQKSDGPTDAKKWDWYAGISNELSLRLVNDAYSAATDVMKITRSGMAVSNTQLLSNLSVTGTLTTNNKLTVASSTQSGGADIYSCASGEGGELRFLSADGSFSSPTTVSNGKVLSDISVSAYVGSAYQDVFYHRVSAGIVSGGYAPASYSWMFRNGASLVTTMTATATGISASVPITSTVANGTAPFVVASTTKVANLNADILDDMTASATAVVNTIAARDGNGDLVSRATLSYAGSAFNIDTFAQTGGYWSGIYGSTGAGSSGTAPANSVTVAQLYSNGTGQGIQLAASYAADQSYYIRRRSDNSSAPNGSGAWQPWNKIVTNADKGVANGVASLDGSGTIPVSQLPASVNNGVTMRKMYFMSTM